MQFPFLRAKTHTIFSSQALQIRPALPAAQGWTRIRRVREGIRAVRSGKGKVMGLVQQPSSHALNSLFIPSYSPPPSPTPPAPLSTMCSSTSNAEVPSRGPDCPTAAPPPPARAMSSFTHMSNRKFRGGMLVLSGAVHAAAAAAALHIPCSHIEWLPSPIGTGRDGTGECVAIAGIAEQVSTCTLTHPSYAAIRLSR